MSTILAYTMNSECTHTSTLLHVLQLNASDKDPEDAGTETTPARPSSHVPVSRCEKIKFGCLSFKNLLKMFPEPAWILFISVSLFATAAYVFENTGRSMVWCSTCVICRLLSAVSAVTLLYKKFTLPPTAPPTASSYFQTLGPCFDEIEFDNEVTRWGY